MTSWPDHLPCGNQKRFRRRMSREAKGSNVPLRNHMQSAALLKLSAQRERENFNYAVFALAFFSRRQDRELPGAISRGLLDCPCRF